MADDEVVPHVGIRTVGGEMLRLGMTRKKAAPLLATDKDLQVEFGGTPPTVSFIQSPKHWGTFDGIELFEDSADSVVAQIVARFGFDPSLYRPGRHTYYFPTLRMSLWRSCVSEFEGEQGYIFDCVSLHVPGNYTDEILELVRTENGWSPEVAMVSPLG
jgi:hypothetical protein